MIYISQGHEKGIGLEVFLKSFICLNKNQHKKYLLFVNQKDLLSNLNNLKIEYEITQNNLVISNSILQCEFFETIQNISNSTLSLSKAMEKCGSKDILLTLPTSKDQLTLNSQQVNGHTEFFRKHFKLEEIAMSFLGENSNFLLLTDHISIDAIPKALNLNFIVSKVSIGIMGFVNQRKIKEVYFSGINPHCGESGYISKEDQVIDKAINELKIKFPDIIFHEQQAGDTLHFNIRNKHQLFIYASHDQGLAPFKLKYGLTGINYSIGLPFRRVSVDHGTAFSLFGKNQANYIGMLYLLNEIDTWS